MIKAVLFDYFGVLYPDTFWSLANLYVPERDEELQQQMHDLIRRADSGLIDQKEFWEEAAELFHISRDELAKKLEAFDGVDQGLLSIIKALRGKGMMTGIISNVGNDVVRYALGDDVDLFDCLILSADSGVMKPDPRAYEMALAQLQLEAEECLFVDDIDRNVIGAEEVGMQAIHYTGLKDFQEQLAKIVKI